MLKFWPLSQRAQNGYEKVGVFVTGTMNSHFFVSGQIGMNSEKGQSLSSIEP